MTPPTPSASSFSSREGRVGWGVGVPSLASLGLQAVQQALQLLLTQVYFVFQLVLLDDEH